MELDPETEALIEAVAEYWRRLTKQPLSQEGIQCLRRFRILGLDENDLASAMELAVMDEPDRLALAFMVFCHYCWKDIACIEIINPAGCHFSKKQGGE